MSVQLDKLKNMTNTSPRLLITDLDNTLWDWFTPWHKSFSGLIQSLSQDFGLDMAVLKDQIRDVHQRVQTTEYSNLLREVPVLKNMAGNSDPFEFFGIALHRQNSLRKRNTKLYTNVLDTLLTLKSQGVRIVAYTESGAFWTEWRIRVTGLDGIIDILYSSVDHDIEAGVQPASLRTGHYPEDSYGLKDTVHYKLPLSLRKPNAEVLMEILENEDCAPRESVYIGDSLMKDIVMAQAAEVPDVYAKYGVAHNLEEYELLRQVTHWSQQDVEREKELANNVGEVTPTFVCEHSFSEVLPLFLPQENSNAV